MLKLHLHIDSRTGNPELTLGPQHGIYINFDSDSPLCSCAHSLLDAVKSDDGAFGRQQRRQTECSFGDNTQSALSTNEEFGRIESSCGLPCPLTSLDDLSAGQDDGL